MRIVSISADDFFRMSSCVRDMEPLRFTKYTEECCNTVSLVPEFPTDTLLVPLVRTAHLADKIVQTICSDDFDLPGLYSTPLGLSIRGFEAELRRLKASFPCEPPYSSETSNPELEKLAII